MDALRQALDVDVVRKTSGPTGAVDPGRLLRNGLAVVGFAAFEDFFEQRAGEVLQRLDYQRVPFAALPEPLQEAATAGVLDVLRHKFDRRVVPDLAARVAGLQGGASEVASTGQAAYVLSQHTFSLSRSNINHEQVKHSLVALDCKDPWKQMTALAARCGYGVPDLNSSFRAVTSTRHTAAHGAATDTPVTTLDNIPTELTVTALTWDAIISRTVALIMTNFGRNPNQRKTFDHKDVPIRFVDYDPKDGCYVERLENTRPARRRHKDRTSALASALHAAAKTRALVVERDGRSLPVSWTTGDFP